MFDINNPVSYLEFSNVLTTINTIKKIITNPKQLYYARKLAEIALRNVPDYVHDEELAGILDWVKKHFRYTRDIKGTELVKTVEKMYNEILTHKKFIGDCDDVSTLIAAMLISIGYPVRLVIISTSNNVKDTYNHIFVQGYNKTKKVWRNLDGTLFKKGFNAIVPYKKIKFFSV